MNILWKSTDGYVQVVDDVWFPGDEEESADDRSDLDVLFAAGAWIVVWRGAEKGRWHFTRNRRYSKPGLNALRRVMREQDISYHERAWVAINDAHGHLYNEYSSDEFAIEWGQALHEAWEWLACVELPAKIRFLQLDPNEPAAEKVPAWLRPGLRRYAELRAKERALIEEMYAEA